MYIINNQATLLIIIYKTRHLNDCYWHKEDIYIYKLIKINSQYM